jgi:SAM-dependent methyltransferase
VTDQPQDALAATLRRLKAERDDADALYNDALTTLDRSLPRALPFAALPSPVDDHQVTPLNESWNILPAPPAAGSGLRGRLARFVWRVVGPYFERQLTFNSRLVDHVNRSTAAARAAHAAEQATLAALERHLADLAVFHQRLMLYLQQVTGYVDTKDRDTGAGALVLNAAVSGLAETSAKHWESLAAREARVESRADALAAAQDELRAMISVSQQGVLSLKRAVERAGAAPEQPAAAAAAPGGSGPVFAPLDAYKYVGFEDQFRGSQADIRRRLESYLPFFDGVRDVLDVGCGRGEFLDLLGERGIPARGLDSNHEMAEVCRARGLDVAEADAVTYLTALPDGSLGGLFAAQVVEHLPPAYLLRLLELAFHKLRPGGRLVLETLNPACWVAFFDSYIRDITHVWPLHPDTLKYLVSASGFTRTRIEFRSPVAAEDRLQPIAVAGAERALADLAEAFNANVEKLNSRMFTFLDYAVVAER